MMYSVTNNGRSPRVLYSGRTRGEEFKPGETRELPLPDGMAVFIRRCQLRGDKLEIVAKEADGERVLEKAHIPVPKKDRFLTGPRPRVETPFVDELANSSGEGLLSTEYDSPQVDLAEVIPEETPPAESPSVSVPRRNRRR